MRPKPLMATFTLASVTVLRRRPDEGGEGIDGSARALEAGRSKPIAIPGSRGFTWDSDAP